VTAAILRGSRFGGRIHWGMRKSVTNGIEVPFTFDGQITDGVIEAMHKAISKKSNNYKVTNINFSTNKMVVVEIVNSGEKIEQVI
jgi:hypothetical protein